MVANDNKDRERKAKEESVCVEREERNKRLRGDGGGNAQVFPSVKHTSTASRRTEHVVCTYVGHLRGSRMPSSNRSTVCVLVTGSSDRLLLLTLRLPLYSMLRGSDREKVADSTTVARNMFVAGQLASSRY